MTNNAQQQGHGGWDGLSNTDREQWITVGNAVMQYCSSQGSTQNIQPEQIGRIAYEAFNGQSGSFVGGAAAGAGGPGGTSMGGTGSQRTRSSR